MAAVRAASGHRIGPYELGERLGSGGMAEVYVGHRAGPGGFQKKFAIKRILPQLARDSRFVAMFCDEARICAALTHPNIVQVVDFGEQDGHLFMAMEYVEGVSCARLLRAVAARGERFPVGAAVFIAHEVLRGLRFAHEARDEEGRPLGVVHRDVSPGNILIGTAGEVKLTDFGIVLSAFVDRRTYPGELKGKMGYMSPEQVIGEEVDPRSDLFTLAIVLTEMLLARPLFPGCNELDMLTRMYQADLGVLTKRSSELTPELLDVLHTALSREKERRYQSARDFEDALRGVARRIAVPLNDTQLVPWLYNLGVLPGRSGTRPAGARRAARRPARRRAADGLEAPQQRRASQRPPSALAALGPGPSYRVWVGSKSHLGPVSLPQLLELVATGRLRAGARVKEEGEEFVPLEQVPALARLVARPAYHFGDSAGASALWRPLRRRYLPRALFELARSRESGLIIAQSGRRQKRVYLKEGVPEFIASSDPGELLGARLVHAGLVRAEEVDGALLRGAESGQRLGEVLVMTGLLPATALLRALTEQLEARFMALGRWTRGQLLFVPRAEHGEPGVRHQASGISLVARAVHAGFDDVEIASLLAAYLEHPVSWVAKQIDLGELHLSPGQRRALELAPRAESVAALASGLARDAGVRPEETLRGVFLGLCSGLLETAGWL